MDETGLLGAILEAHLADRLEEGQRLDVAHGAANLDQRDVGALRALADRQLDLVGDVRDDLDRAAEVVAAALLVDHRLVDLTGGEVVALAHARAGKALVMTEVE